MASLTTVGLTPVREPIPRPISPKTTGAAAAVAATRGCGEVEQLLESLVASWQVSRDGIQNRRWHRVVYRKRFQITPLDEHTWKPVAEPLYVDGRDLCLGGVSFHHIRPLPYRLVAVTFAEDQPVCSSIGTRLTWCRFTRDGAYLSGGRFLRTIEL